MNREDIIRMLREVCDKDKVDAWQNGFWVITQEELERFAALIVSVEREACAKIADEYVGQDLEHNFSALIAHNIRARVQT